MLVVTQIHGVEIFSLLIFRTDRSEWLLFFRVLLFVVFFLVRNFDENVNKENNVPFVN